MKLKEANIILYNLFNDEINFGIDKDLISITNNSNYYYWNCVNGHIHRARLNNMLKGANCIYCLHAKKLNKNIKN